MTAVEMIKKLDDMVTNKVNILNHTLDNEKPFEEQSEGWKRLFNELKGLTIYAQNIDKNWHIEFDTDIKNNYNLNDFLPSCIMQRKIRILPLYSDFRRE